MRRICVSLLFISLSIGCGSIGYAADMPVKMPVKAAPIMPVPAWTGVYIGGSLGGAWGRRDFTFDAGTAPAPNPADFGSGFVGGGFVGAQWQWSQFVLGVEANWDGMSLKNTESCPNPVISCVTSATQFWTVGPRVGWAVNQFLIYGTGGYASTKTKYEADTAATGALLESGSSWNNGWFLGAGAEMMLPAILPGLVVGIDYKHVRANTTGVTATTPAGALGDGYHMNASIDTVQVRLSYLWNWMK